MTAAMYFTERTANKTIESELGRVVFLNRSDTHFCPARPFHSSVDDLQVALWGLCGTIIVSLGLIGNVLSLVTLNQSRLRRSSTSVYLIALAVFDSILLLAFLLFVSIPTWNEYIQFEVFPLVQPYAYPLSLISHTCVIYTTVGFSVDRYIAVCHPFSGQTFCTTTRSRRVVLVITVACILYNVPRWLEFEVNQCYDIPLGKNLSIYKATALGQNEAYRRVYHIYMYITLMFGIPCLLLIGLNVRLLVAVHRSLLYHRQLALGTRQQRDSGKQRRTTIITVIIIMVFLACHVTSIIDNIFLATVDHQVLISDPFHVRLTTVNNIMVVLNSSCNFIIYTAIGQKFRRVFVATFCPACIMKRMQRSSNHTRFPMTLMTCAGEGSPLDPDDDGGHDI